MKESLQVVGAIMTDTNMTIHLSNNLPIEYSNVLEMMEIVLTNKTNPLTLTNVRERLWSKIGKLKKSGMAKKKNDEYQKISCENNA